MEAREEDRQPKPEWLSTHSPWAIEVGSSSSNLKRLCNMLRALNKTGNRYHHEATAKEQPEPGVYVPDPQLNDVSNLLIDRLHEVFRKDESRMPKARQARILV